MKTFLRWLLVVPVAVWAQCPTDDLLTPQCGCSMGELHCEGALEGRLTHLLREGLCGHRLRALALSRVIDLPSPLPDNLVYRVALAAIRIADSPLTELEGFLGQEHHVTELSVRGCGLQEARGLGRLRGLRSLDLSRNRLLRPPDPLPPSLHTLLLRGNRITSVEGLEGLHSLVQLDLSENLLTTLPAPPSPNLIFLDVSQNRVSSWSESLWSGNLRRLDLSDNLLTELPEHVWAPGWGDLDRLDLSGNPIDCREEWLKVLKPPRNLYGCPIIDS